VVSLLTEELASEFGTIAVQMRGDVGEDPAERADAEEIVRWDRHMVFTTLMRRQTQMAPGLVRRR
jgi:hypothetical protein